MTTDLAQGAQTLYAQPKKSVMTLLRENPYVLGLACVSSCADQLEDLD